MKLLQCLEQVPRKYWSKPIVAAINHYGRFLGHEPTAEDLTDVSLNRFLLHLRDETGFSTRMVQNTRNALASLWNGMFDSGMIPLPTMYVLSVRGLSIGKDGKPRVANAQQSVRAFARMLRSGYSGRMIAAAERFESWHGGPFPVCLLMPSKINAFLATLTPDEAATTWPHLLDLWTAAAKRNLAQPPRPAEIILPTGKKPKRTTRELADKLLAALNE